MTAEKFEFQTEVSKLLNIVTNALYSDTEVFLREIISNSSDACDKLRYAALTNADLLEKDADFKITLTADKEAKTLTIADNGIGMSRDDLIANLGTIARSGTAAFIEQLEKQKSDDLSMIGQFGVGFYSAFMVAYEIDVITRKAGEKEAWVWTSQGQGAYSIDKTEKAERGTTIILKLKDDCLEFAESARLEHITKKYSDHIAIPIQFTSTNAEEEDKTLNTASALWARPKSEITAEQYKEFYHHCAHAYDEPAATMHFDVEGVLAYKGLLFIPGSKPYDLFQPERLNKLKLYVKKIFITDNCQELLPPYLRFVQGVIDSEDLPLNISREMLQKNPMLSKMNSAITKRVLNTLTTTAKKDAEKYQVIWENFGTVLKEGLYDDATNRETLLELSRFKSSTTEGLISLDDYVSRMKENQDTIYFLTGEDLKTIERSPQLEGFKSRGIEVLLMDDAVDRFWVSSVNEFKGKQFKSISRGTSDLDKFEAEDKKAEETADKPNMDSLIGFMKTALKDKVKDVKTTNRLTESPVCLVSDESALDPQLEAMLKQHGQLGSLSLRILEINPSHPMIAAFADAYAKDNKAADHADMASILLDQAKIAEGENPEEPALFVKKVNGFIKKSFAA